MPHERLAQTAPDPPHQAASDAFIGALVPKPFTDRPVPAEPSVAAHTAPADNPPATHIATEVWAIHDPNTCPEPAARLTYCEPDKLVEPPPALQSRVSIGRMTMIVERVSPPPPDRVVTRIVKPRPVAGRRAASAWPRFGLAQS